MSATFLSRSLPAGLLALSIVFVAAKPVVAVGSTNQKIYPLLGKGYDQLRKGKYEEAVNTLVLAVRTDRDSITARRYLAFALLKNGSHMEALDQLELISRIVKPGPFDWYLFGESYLKAGGYKEAEDCFKQAVALSPGYDAARAGLINTYAATGKWQDGFTTLAEGMKLARSNNVKSYYKSLYAGLKERQASGYIASQAPVYNANPYSAGDSSSSDGSGGPVVVPNSDQGPVRLLAPGKPSG